jgi:hypothetical protein
MGWGAWSVVGRGSAAADGREERNFVTGLERGGPSGKFAIAGDGDSGSMFGQGGIAGYTVGEEVLDTRARRDFHGLLTVTNGVLQSSKKEHTQAYGIGVCGGHMGIVALGRDCGQRSGRGVDGFGHGGA